jgi:hydroxymethylpyrimidine/phosphomethylpyrimidine kinase
MKESRPYVLSIAGFDPSAGAGILADIKTFENNETYGFGVISALTYQNDSAFEKVEWMSVSQIIKQIEVLQKRFEIRFVKIGLIKDFETLNKIVGHFNKCKIVWDPILKASAGFEFHKNVNEKLLEDICKQLYLITPNINEALELGHFNNVQQNAEYLSSFCNVYLKGGHDEENTGRDILYFENKKQLIFEASQTNLSSKHGSGCVLSSAITANLAKGMSLENACAEGKKYVSAFLASNDSLLGYHKVVHEFQELK